MADGKEIVLGSVSNEEYDELEFELNDKWRIPSFSEIIQLKSSREVPVEWKNCVIGKLFAPRHVENANIQKDLHRSWKAKKKVQVDVLETGYFKIKFECDRNLRFVLRNGPWQVEGYVFSTKPWKPNTPLEDYPFCWVPMWIQVFGLPPERKEAIDLYDIVAAFGRDTIEIDSVGGKDKSGSYARIHVLFHIRRPVIKNADVMIGNKKIQIRFKYERLPLFCYYCGLIGHNFKICPDYLNNPVVIQSEGQTPVKKILKFSDMLRAREYKMGTCIINKSSFNLDPVVEEVEQMGVEDQSEGMKIFETPVAGECAVVDPNIRTDIAAEIVKPLVSRDKDAIMVSGLAQQRMGQTHALI